MQCKRIWFEKKGMSRYISHLDLMRTVTRAVRRSKIPLWYTEGFNPHPYMTFSLPLSLGMESEYESMDIRLEGEMADEEILSRLSAAMPEGINITAVTDPVLDPKTIAFGEFEILFFGEFDKADFCERANEALSKDELIVQKLGKQGRRKVYKDVNLIEFIKSYNIAESDEGAVLSVILPAGSTSNINPSLLSGELLKLLAENTGCLITRKRLMTADMTDFK